MNRCAIIATHHKTGTVWMRSIFQGIATQLDIPFVSMKKREFTDKKGGLAPKILFNDHSHFLDTSWMLDHPDCRVFHIIRDPRDVIISAMHYHRTAKEHWLHKPRKMFGEMTYQQKVNSLPSDHARYLFEMQHSGMRIIRDMRQWDYTLLNCLDCKYEDLIDDINMTLFTNVLLHLGFEEAELDACRKTIWKHSLFGKRQAEKSKHIRSGEGRQWPKLFDKTLAAAFVKQFGDVLVELGYEPNNSWVEQFDPLSVSASSELPT